MSLVLSTPSLSSLASVVPVPSVSPGNRLHLFPLFHLFQRLAKCSAKWDAHLLYSGMCCALHPEGHRFASTSSHCGATLDKLVTHNCLRGRQREITSLISSPGGVKANEPAFGQRTVQPSPVVVRFLKFKWTPLQAYYGASLKTGLRRRTPLITFPLLGGP